MDKIKIHAPGTVYEYSDFGPILAGKICEIVSGQSFDMLASSLIFKPFIITFHE